MCGLSGNSLNVTLWSFYRLIRAIIGDSRNEMISQNDLMIEMFYWLNLCFCCFASCVFC